MFLLTFVCPGVAAFIFFVALLPLVFLTLPLRLWREEISFGLLDVVTLGVL